MTLRILTCSNTSFIVEATKFLLRMSLIATFKCTEDDTSVVGGSIRPYVSAPSIRNSLSYKCRSAELLDQHFQAYFEN